MVGTLRLVVAAVLFSCTIVFPPLGRAQPEEVGLRVAISPFEPFVMLQPGQEPAGFSVDLWRALADRLEVDYRFVEFSGVADKLAAVREGAVDVAIGGISITREREESLDFIKQESDKLKKGQRVPGHTEVLESLFGKYKQIQGRHSQGGMTASLLNIGAATLKQSPQVIEQALAAIPVKAVNDWVRNNLGQTVASRRKLALE